MSFLSSVQGVNSGQTGASITGFAVLFPGMPALNRLEPGALAVDPTTRLLAQEQQTMQLMLTTMLSLLVGLLQGNLSNNANSNGAGSTSNAGGNTTPGAPGDKVTNAKIVAEVARQKGVDPVTAVACMLVESGGSNASTGDNGTSFGLFQLHRGGELGNMTEAEARDPRRNAEVALSVFAANKGKYSDPGQLAAASQRPADRAGYARKVDAMLPEARRLLGM